LTLEIQDPGSPYRGSRFDWTGQIIQAILNGKHSFCTSETDNPLYLDSRGRGFYNEFGIDLPIGYDACMPGERFHKIGAGLVKKKDNRPYSFSENYEILPVNIEKEIFSNKIVYNLNAPLVYGFAYQLKKTVALEGPAFSIFYELKNTGTKAICTSEYVHNFISLNSRNINQYYRLSFPFEIESSGFLETVNPLDKVTFEGNRVSWKAQVETPFFFSRFNQIELNNCSWELIHVEEKIGLREVCSASVNLVNLWGDKHVVSPELFHPINLLPGEKDNWERKFEFFEYENKLHRRIGFENQTGSC
jgi:hypothetical protein